MVGLELGLVWSAGQRVTDLFSAWHSAPQNCRDRLLQGITYCLGSSEEQRWVATLELSFLTLALAFAFTVGRLTAHIPFARVWRATAQATCRVAPSRKCVQIRT